MFRPQAQAETHSKARGPLHASRRPCAETHSRPGGPALASRTYFFLFFLRLQAQAHSRPGSMLQGSRA